MLGLRSLHTIFFFKQKTAYEMRISDWSSDVCSSDLLISLASWSPRTSASTNWSLPSPSAPTSAIDLAVRERSMPISAATSSQVFCVGVINPKRDDTVAAAAEALYRDLSDAGIETVLDDRALRPGQMFPYIELIGLPHPPGGSGRR